MTSIQDQNIQGIEAHPSASDMAEIEHSRQIYSDQHHQVFCESGDLRGESGELLSIAPIADGYQYLVMSGEHYITGIQFQDFPVEKGVTGITPELLLTILIDHLTTMSDVQPCSHKDGAVHLLRQAQAVLMGSLPMMQDMIQVTMDCLSPEEKDDIKALISDACANTQQSLVTPEQNEKIEGPDSCAMIAAEEAEPVFSAYGLQILSISGKLKVDDDAGNSTQDTYTVPEGHVYWAGSDNQQVNSLMVFHQGDIGNECVNGLTTESLLYVLKHRTQILNKVSPSKENELAIKGMDSAIEAFDIQSKRLGAHETVTTKIQ